uniref:Uncharacterized protein n=1 Tax=Heterorhabditis bacteriophora TaxID=37862 RepID=A0A1I7WM93_HETBA
MFCTNPYTFFPYLQKQDMDSSSPKWDFQLSRVLSVLVKFIFF